MNRQVKVLNAIMQNWSIVQDTIRDANEAAGTAMQGNELYVDSIEGRITALQSAFQRLSDATINSGFVKGLVSIGTFFVNLATDAGGLVPVLGTVIGLLAGFKADKIAKGFTSIANAFKLMFGAASEGASKLSAGISAFGGYMTMITAAGAAIAVTSNIANQVANKPAENLIDSKNKLVEEQSKLESINSELETTKRLVQELSARGSLTVVEQDELDRAKERTLELERQKVLQNELLRIAEKQVRIDTVKSIQTKQGTSNASTSVWDLSGSSYYNKFNAGVKNLIRTRSISPDNPNASLIESEERGVDYTYLGYVEANKQALPILRQQLTEAQNIYNQAIDAGESERAKQLYKNLQAQQQYYDDSMKVISDYYNYLNEQIGDTSYIEGATSEADKAFNALYEERDALEEFITSMSMSDAGKAAQSESIFAKYTDDVEKLKKAYADLGSISTDYLTQNFSAFTEEFTKLGWTADEVAQHLNEVFSAPVEAESATTFDELYSSLYRTTDAYTALTKAMKEQSDSGVLSLETYKELIKTYPEFIELMDLTAEGYAINTEKAYEYIEAQDEENLVRMKAIATIADLQAEQDNEGVDNSTEIQALENLIGQLDSATSAYQRFLAAKKTANQDEMHTQGKGAVDSIKEGLESGKVGTDDYKSALGFILGGDWEGKTVEELTAAGKEAQKIAQKYFSGNDKKDAKNFANALVEGGFAEWTGDNKDQLQLFDTVNIAEAAEKLGIGEEAAESLFKLLEAYGADFDWEMFTENEVKNAKDIVEATETLNKDTEERKETQQEIVDKQKEQNKGGADEVRAEKQWRKEQEQIEANQAAIDAMNESVSATEAPTLDTMSIDELKQYVTELADAINTINSAGLTPNVALQGDYENAKAFLEKLEAEQPTVEVNVTANTEGADTKLETTNQNVENLDGATADPTITVNDQASTTLGSVKSEIENIPEEKIVTVTVQYENEHELYLPNSILPDGTTTDENGRPTGQNKHELELPSSPPQSKHELELPEIWDFEQPEIEPTIDPDIKRSMDEWFGDNPIEAKVEASPDSNLTEQVQDEVSESGGIEVPVTPQPSSGTLPPMPTTSTVTMSADTSSAESAISGVASDANATETMTVTADTSSAEASISALDRKASAQVTKTVKINTVGILPYASGTKNAVGGMSLVDEKGAELIEHTNQGTFELGTDNGARFTTLEKGDVVHTARETKSILSRMAKIGGFFRDGLNKTKSVIGNAFASGVSGSMSFSLLNEILGGSGKKSSSSKKLSNSKLKKYIEKLFDWIEIRLKYLQTQTDKFLLSASEAIGYFAKNSELDKALASVSNQVEASAQAYTRYMQEADTIAQKAGLSAETVKNLQEGLIDITQVDKKVQENYKNYLNYYNKAQELVETLADLREQERELAGERLDNIVDYYQWRIDRLEAVADASASRRELKTATGIQITEADYQDAIDATNQKIQELTDSYSALSDEFANMIALGYIQEGSEAWYDYTAKLEDLDDTIIQTKVDLQDLIDEADNVTLTNLQYAMAFLESSATKINQMISLHESQGMDGDAADYDKLIRNGMQQIANLEAQNKELERQQQGLDVLSEKYQELQNQIDSNNASIMDLKVSQEEWNDAVLDLQIKKIQDYKDELSKTNDQYERQKKLQQSLEDLERARTQRTQRVYRGGEGGGFVYEADQNALRDATDSLQDVVEDELMNKLDDLIDALEDYKTDTNVYDANGNLLGAQYSLPSIDFSELLFAYSGSNILSDALKSAKNAAYQSVLAGASSKSINVSVGDVIVNEADDGTALAESVIAQFPNALLQELHSKY